MSDIKRPKVTQETISEAAKVFIILYPEFNERIAEYYEHRMDGFAFGQTLYEMANVDIDFEKCEQLNSFQYIVDEIHDKI